MLEDRPIIELRATVARVEAIAQLFGYSFLLKPKRNFRPVSLDDSEEKSGDWVVRL